MSKKAILGILLASATLLGAASVSHAETSAIKSESKKITITSDKAKLYKDSTMKESTTAKKGAVYQVNGYRDINGKHVYRLYQKDQYNKDQYKGYLVSTDAKDLKSADAKGQFVAKKGATMWENFYWNNKREVTSQEKVFFAKYSYTLGNGDKYYSMYYKNADGKDTWAGYTNAVNVNPLKAVETSKYVTLKKDYNTWANLYFKQHKTQFAASKGVNFKVKRYYELNGNKFYSTYRTDSKGKEVWTGYVNGYSSVVEDLKANKVAEKDQKVQVAKDYSTYKNHFFNKNGQLKVGQRLTMKVTYTYGNGKKYASLYDGDKWLGYANVDAVQAEMEQSNLDALKAIMEQVEKIPTKKQYVDAKASAEGIQTLTDNYNTAKAILDGKKVVSNEELTDIYNTLQYESCHLALKTDAINKAIADGKKALENKANYLPGGVGNLESAIKKAEQVKGNNILKNLNNFNEQSSNIEKAINALKENANSVMSELNTAINDVKKIDGIKQDLANSKFDEIKKVYNDAETMAGKEANQVAKEDVLAAKDALVKTAEGMGINHTRLNQAEKTVQDDAKKYYLTADQAKEAKEKLQPIVDKAEAAKTLKDYTAYNDAVKVLEKANTDMTSLPLQANVNMVVKEYDALKDKAKDWKENKHKDVFSPETEAPFVDALKAVSEVGKAVENKAAITKEQLAEAEKAPQTAAGLKFNAELIDKKVNQPAEQLVQAAKELASYANTSSNQNGLTTKIKSARTALGIQSAEKVEPNVNAINDGHWNKNGWKAIDEAEDAVVKSGKNLQVVLKKPLQTSLSTAESKLGSGLTEDTRKPLQAAVDKAEDDLNNNKYTEFDEDKQALDEAIKAAKENGVAESENLKATMEKVKKIQTDIPAEDLANSQFTNIKNAYDKAEKVMEDPANVIKAEVENANTNLVSAAKKVPLNVNRLKTEGTQFQKMVGSTGDGGTYYIDSTQTTQLKAQKTPSVVSTKEEAFLTTLDSIYQDGVKATTLEKYAEFDKADQIMKKAIRDVEDNCPTMEDVRTARGYKQKLTEKDFYGSNNKPKYKVLFESETVGGVEVGLNAVKAISTAVPSKAEIKKAQVDQALNLKHAMEALQVNVPKLESDLNDKAEQYANQNKDQAPLQTTTLLQKVNEANNILKDKQNTLVVKDNQWNTNGINKVYTAEKAIYDAAKAVQQAVAEKEKNTVISDKATLENPAKLSRAILSKEDEAFTNMTTAKELAKVVKAASEVDANSTGNEEKSIAALDNNRAWTEFGDTRKGTYYDAYKTLQDYAKDASSVEVNTMNTERIDLEEDMEGLRVLTNDLKSAMTAAEQAETQVKSDSEVTKTTDELIQEAKVIVESKTDSRRGIDNWEHINELTAQLKAATQKVKSIFQK